MKCGKLLGVMEQYMADNDGYLPPADTWHDALTPVVAAQGRRWWIVGGAIK